MKRSTKFTNVAKKRNQSGDKNKRKPLTGIFRGSKSRGTSPPYRHASTKSPQKRAHPTEDSKQPDSIEFLHHSRRAATRFLTVHSSLTQNNETTNKRGKPEKLTSENSRKTTACFAQQTREMKLGLLWRYCTHVMYSSATDSSVVRGMYSGAMATRSDQKTKTYPSVKSLLRVYVTR